MNTFMDRVNGIVQKNQAATMGMAPPQSAAYPDAGLGALENVANNVPRQTMIRDQPHMLAYINPAEEGMLQDYRNDAPVFAGPDGVPAYSWHADAWDSFTTGVSNIGTGISNAVSNIGTGISNTVADSWSEIKTGGDAITDTYNSTTSQDDIDKTVAANVGSSFNNNVITGADGNTISVGTNVNADTFTDNTITTGVGTPSVVFPADEPIVPLSYGEFSANFTLDNGQSIPVTQYADGTVAYFPDGAGGQSFSSQAAVNQYLGIGTTGTDTTTIETTPIETTDTTIALTNVGTDIPTFANYKDAIDAGYLDKEVIINGQNVIAKMDSGYTGTGAGTGTGTGTGTTPNVLELSMLSTKTQAEAEAEARAAGQEMYAFKGNFLPVTVETTDTGTGSNTLLQDLTNLVTFAGNKSYVNGVEITTNNMGQNFANYVKGKDNWDYQGNILYDLTTGLPVVGTEAEEAFFNTGYDETTGTYENKDGAATSDEFIGPMPDYKDKNGVVHNSQAEANEADIAIDVTLTDRFGLVHTSLENKIAADAIVTETDRRIARENNVQIRTRASGTTYLDMSGNAYASLQEAIDSNATLVAANTTSVTTEAVGALPAADVKMTGENSLRETFANLLTFGDSAFYEGGTLYGYDKDGNVIDLTGGGETFDRLTGVSNYVYGVSDNPNTGASIDTTGMTQDEKNVAIAKKQMLYDIAPDDLEYFASFLPGLMIPGELGEIAQVASYFGGSIGDLMLKGGIEDRRAILAEETAALEAGATPMFNDAGEYTGHDTGANDEYNLNYDSTGGNTTIGALPTTTTTLTDAQKAAYEQYADTMTAAGVLSLGGKQTPKEPAIVGNTPILEYSDGGYTVVGALNDNNDAINATLVAKGKEPIYGNNDVTPTLSYNADGTVFVPYGGEDPHTITAETAFIGSTDPNAEDYNMSLDLVQTGTFVDLSGKTVTDDAFATDLTANGAAVLNELGKDNLLKTGDDSKMIVGVEGGGYQYVDGTPITNKILEDAVVQAVDDGILSEDVLEVFELEDEDEKIVTTVPRDDGSDNADIANSIYNRYYKGGSGAGLPMWLRKYASGKNINQLLEKVTVEGEVYYKTTDKPPKYIKEIELVGAVDLGVEDVSATSEE